MIGQRQWVVHLNKEGKARIQELFDLKADSAVVNSALKDQNQDKEDTWSIDEPT